MIQTGTCLSRDPIKVLSRYSHSSVVKITHIPGFAGPLAWRVLAYAILLGMALSSCNPGRHLPENQFLLTRVQVDCDCDETGLRPGDFKSLIKQNPNTRIFFTFRPYLWVYNLTNRGKDRAWKRKMREIIGEEPVVYDSYQKDRTIRQMNLFLKNRGFYNGHVTDSVVQENRKAKVFYRIFPGRAILFGMYKYPRDSAGIYSEIHQYLDRNSLIQEGSPLNMDMLQEERTKLVSFLRNNGYFAINREYFEFLIDTLAEKGKANVELRLREPRVLPESGVKNSPLDRYRIRMVQVIPDFEVASLLAGNAIIPEAVDTLPFGHLTILSKKDLLINPEVLAQAVTLQPGQWFDQSAADQCYRFLSDLQQFKFINIQFVPVMPAIGDTGSAQLDCIVQLVPDILQDFQTELEGTNSSGNIGIGGNISYSHKNFFHGAEIFNLTLRGSLQSQTDIFGSKSASLIPNTVEYGVETGISLPRFLFPLLWKKLESYHPRTRFSLSLSFQDRPDYNRTIAQASMGYFYRSSPKKSHYINPLVLNIIDLRDTTADFAQSIQNLYIKNSYEPQVLSVFSYSYIYNGQVPKSQTGFSFLRWNIEMGGNTLLAYNALVGNERSGEGEGYYTLFNTRFAQFFRTDAEYTRTIPLKPSHFLVYRGLMGIGIPYGNSEGLPFVKKFFAGGANSIRAWLVRSLGPGSFPDTTNLPNLSGDIRLETNLEYRFPLFWRMKGALFLDAGNIWALNQSTDNRPGAAFDWNSFVSEIAVGTGFGARFDFEIFIFRFDLGLKLHDPTLPSGERWKIRPSQITSKDLAINVGIGYPF